jgi:putative cardiolipin synthase
MDRRKLFIGSMNFDQRSMHLNTEIGLLIDSPVLAQQVAARFEAMTRPQNAYNLVFNSDAAHQDDIVWLTQEDGHAVTYLTEPARSGWQRFEANFFALLPIGSEL